MNIREHQERIEKMMEEDNQRRDLYRRIEVLEKQIWILADYLERVSLKTGLATYKEGDLEEDLERED